jgi:phage terminase small subunit
MSYHFLSVICEYPMPPAPTKTDTPAWAAELTLRERRFVEEYVIDLSARSAAIRAGLGKTAKSASEIASRMRKKSHVAAAINALMAERSGVTSTAVVDEIGKLAFAKMTDFVRVENGSLIITDTSKLTEDQQAAIAEITETVNESGRAIRVKLHDKLSALDKLAKVLSLYKERETSPTVAVNVTVNDVRARVTARMEELARRAAEEDRLVPELSPPIRRVETVPAPIMGRVIDAE